MNEERSAGAAVKAQLQKLADLATVEEVSTQKIDRNAKLQEKDQLKGDIKTLNGLHVQIESSSPRKPDLEMETDTCNQVRSCIFQIFVRL